jgi:hypothetical protein
VDLALLTYYDEWLRDIALPIVNTARHHDAHTRHLLPTVPGIGKMLRRVLRYDIHDVNRFPRGQDFVSSGRLGTCAREAAGQRDGTSGTTIGKAHLTWAFSEAPSCSAETIRQPSKTSPAERKNMTKVRHAPSWPSSWPVPSLIGSNAMGLSLGRRSASEQGGERMRLGPHGPPMGCTCTRRLRVLHALRP